MIYLKADDIQFDWSSTPMDIFMKAEGLAKNYARMNYMEEHDFVVEDFASSGLSKEDYLKENSDSAEYFEEFSFNLPIVKRDVEGYKDIFLRNYHDIPQTVMVCLNEKAEAEIMGKNPHASTNDFVDLAETKAYFAKVVEKDYGVPCKVVKASNCKNGFKDYIKKLGYDAIKNMTEEEDYKRFLTLQNNIQKYSFANISKIFAQKPTATMVEGGKGWEKYGRKVDFFRGKKIWILSPIEIKMKTKEQVDKYIDSKIAYFKDKITSPRLLDRVVKDLEKDRTAYYSKVNTGNEVRFIEGMRDNYIYDISDTTVTDPSKDIVGQMNKKEAVTIENNASRICKALTDITGFDVNAEAESIYDALYAYIDDVLATNPASVTGIKASEPLKGDAHTAEILLGINSVSDHIGLDCKARISKELAILFNRVKNSLYKSRYDTFEEAFNRGRLISSDMIKAIDEKVKPKEKSKNKCAGIDR